jgi:hemerythrin
MWKNEYSVKQPSLDLEHKNLFKLIASITPDPQNSTLNPLSINDILNQLMDYYSQTHFKHEVLYMTQIHYPFIEHHAELHDYYLKK